MKKSLAIVMTLIFTISMFAGISVSAFSDVPDDHRHGQAIDYLAGKGVINGYEDGSFKPEDTITRAEFVKMLLEFLGFGNIYGDSIVITNFSDVDGKSMTITSKDEEGNEATTTTVTGQHWAAGYIKLAVDKGVVNGYGDGTFGPDDPVKYEEAIKMIVCCLGREEHAKTRAESLNMPLWPDGYLSIGNDLMVGKSTDYQLGANASRSNIAQMLYNVKDVQIYVAPTINIEGITGNIGGGSVGGGSVGGGSVGGGGVEDSTTIVTGLVAYGQLVAAVKDPGDTKKQIIIDSGIVIDSQPVTSVHSKYIILKLETPIEGNDYEQFYTNGEDFSSYVGQRVELRYSYNPDGGVTGRYEVNSMSVRDTHEVLIDAKRFKRDKTDVKNGQTPVKHICYTNGEEDFEQSLYTEDVNNLTVIYNNKVVDTGSTPLTLSDLMPEVGSIRIVDAYEDNSIDVVWVNTYETFVVGTRSFNTRPKSITDKFRKVGNTATPLELIINDTDPNAIITIKQNGQRIEATAIPQNAILTVVKSKCGTNLDITVERASTMTNTLRSVRTENGVKKSFTMGNSTTPYPLSDYYVKYVDSSLEYENGDNLTLYLNNKNEVIWASVAEIAYSVGYLTTASYNESTEKLTLKILTSTGTLTTFTMSPTKTRYITKATTALSSVEPDSMTNPNGYLYKNLSETLILASLTENANKINYGEDGTADDKPSSMLVNAGTAQPIMYAIAAGTEIYTLVTLDPDMPNRYVNESLKYTLDNGSHKFSNGNDKTFSVPTDATIVFVPNDRTGWDATAFKIGKISSLGTKLIKYMNYNIEPFNTVDANGNPKKSMFVVYNQNIDNIPNYRSENIIVTETGATLSGSSTIYTLTGYVASTTSTKTYKAYLPTYWEKDAQTGAGGAYVLDENFERTGIQRTVEAGDVVRLGFTPTGTVSCVEIIFDASDEFKAGAPKTIAFSKYSAELDTSSVGFEDMVYYYARIGEVTAIDSAVVPEWCKIRLDDGSESQVYIGTGYSNKQILLYDHSETNVENRIKRITMGEVFEGDMLYVWQGENGAFKQIYAVRYPVAPVTP